MAEEQVSAERRAKLDDAFDSRVPWKVEVTAHDNKIYAVRSWSIWIKPTESSPWERLYVPQEPMPLDVRICSPDGNCVPYDSANHGQGVFAKSGVIHFDGGYLLLTDPGIVASLKEVGINVRGECYNSGMERRTITLQHDGKSLEYTPVAINIRVMVTFQTDGNQPFFPLFYCDQACRERPRRNRIVLGERLQAGGASSGDVRNVYWEISGQTPIVSEPYLLAGEHHLQVLEDVDRPEPRDAKEVSEPAAYWEFNVDTINVSPLPPLRPDPHHPVHRLGLGEVEFIVGYHPPTAGTSENNAAVFRGTIKHLEFDPNSHCPNCPT